MVPKELIEFQDLVAFAGNHTIIYTPNLRKAGGTSFVYVCLDPNNPNTILDFFIVDMGIGFDIKLQGPTENGSPKQSTEPSDQRMLRLIITLTSIRRLQRFDPIMGFLTHGHLDHIWGVKMLSKMLPIVWHCSAITEAMVRRVHTDSKGIFPAYIMMTRFEKGNGRLEFGPYILTHFPVVHSLDADGFFASTPHGFHGLHMAEYRTLECSLDHGLTNQMFTGIKQGANIRPYDVVLYDRLRDEPGFSQPEDVIIDVIEAVLCFDAFHHHAALGGMMILPYTSTKLNNSALIQRLANEHNCKMEPAGRAMHEMVEFGRLQGKVALQKPVSEEAVHIIPTTGRFAEHESAMCRAIRREARDLCLTDLDWVVQVEGSIPPHLNQISQMNKDILGMCGHLVISRAEARRQDLPKHPKIIYVEDLIDKPYEPPSGHGRQGDHHILFDAAPVINNDPNRYVGYQSEEDLPPSEDEGEPKLSKLEQQALQERLKRAREKSLNILQ